MSDIVERARQFIWDEPLLPLLNDLAAKIERLRKDVENANFAMCHANDVASTVRAATIEECARVADEFAGGQTAIGRAITQRIRALAKKQK